MLFVVHALDKKDILPTRAKHYRDHRIHLDKSGEHAVDAFTRSDPYHINGVWERVAIHGYNKKRGTAIVSRR